MPSGQDFMWEWPIWIWRRNSWVLMFDLNSSLLIPVECIHATFGFHVLLHSSEHTFEYRHGKWCRFHGGVANLDMASDMLGFDV